MANKKFVNLSNTTHRPATDPYGSVIEKIQKDGVCPFCPEQLLNYHKKPIIKDGTYWLITENMYPYKGARHHFLLIHKDHISHMNEISELARKELFELCDWIFEKYEIKGGTFMMRFGDSIYTGASVTHLHSHIIVADLERPGQEPIIARVG